MFKFISDKERLFKTSRNLESLLARQINTEIANSITFVTLAESGSIDAVTACEHTDLFSPWVIGMLYKIGDLRQHDNILYRCLQEHTSQEDWSPDVANSLWVRVDTPDIEFPEWSQPVGAHDAYMKDDKVSYNEKTWISIVDNNVWQPGIYGWEEITE